MLGADVRLGAGATADAARRRRPAGHLARLEADRAAARPGPRARRSRSGARSSWPGGCATPSHAAPWLAVTGTNGKTTTVQMLDAILRAAGLRSVAVGNVGLPIVEAVMDPEPYDVLAVELSSFQLHYTDSMSAESAAVLNVAEDHLDWYAGPAGMADYAADKGRDLRAGAAGLRLQRRPTPRPSGWSARPTSMEGARAIGFTLGMPGVGHARRGRGHPRRPGLHRASARPAPPSCARSPTSPSPGARTSSPTRWPRPRWPGRTASPRPRCATGCAASAPTGTGSPTVAERRRGDLGRRLQGHQPARRPVLAAGLRPRGVGRRRAGQGRPLRRPGASRRAAGCGASCCSAATAT